MCIQTVSTDQTSYKSVHSLTKLGSVLDNRHTCAHIVVCTLCDNLIGNSYVMQEVRDELLHGYKLFHSNQGTALAIIKTKLEGIPEASI